MRLFGINEANHYCSSYSSRSGSAKGALSDFVQSHLGGRYRTLREGTAEFEEFRACSLRDVERCLFLAASHYRRCLDLMLSSAAHWAHVTIYYGSWYSAHAFLGMFGCTMLTRKVIDVNRSTPGNQELRIRSIGNQHGQQPTTYSGTHQRFWDLFYMAVPPLRPLIPLHLAFCLSPVSSNPIWQIEERNKINYETLSAIDLAKDFQLSFSCAAYPNCLPGSLITQYRIFESLLELSFIFAQQFELQTDALANLGYTGGLRDKVRQMIYEDHPPNLVQKTRKGALV